MSKEKYRELIEKQGLHGFALKMTTEAYRAQCSRDLWLRIAVIAFTLLAVLGIGIAWRSIERSENLRIRLVKAREMNRHLKELNLAAAGLAHETRNPLNLVRGQAQVISQNPTVPHEVKNHATQIVEEVDRVTNRLSEFINYSRPATPRPIPVKLSSVIRDVERTLSSDMEEKSIHFHVQGPDLTVEADEALFRQVLFNLVLNAVQAIDNKGQVGVIIEEPIRGETTIHIRDNGPGIPQENKEEVFRPYFTTREGGIGLGLAEVRRIVLAHHWEIEHQPADDRGTVFRISGLKTVRTS
jgi:signal transduction histidine kinase